MVMKSYLSDKELQSLQTELHSSTWISLDNILLLTASVTYDCTGWAPHKEGIHRILGITDLVLISSVSSVQSLSRVWLFVTIWTTAHQASLSITNSQSPPKPMSIESVMPQPSHPLTSPSPPDFNLSQHQGLFKWVSCSHQVAKVSMLQLQHQSFQWTPRTDLL